MWVVAQLNYVGSTCYQFESLAATLLKALALLMLFCVELETCPQWPTFWQTISNNMYSFYGSKYWAQRQMSLKGI